VAVLSPAVQASQKMGDIYEEKTTGKKGHGMGPPHPHKYIALHDNIAARLPDGPDKTFLEDFSKQLDDLAPKKALAKIDEVIPFFRVRVAKGPGGKDKDKDKGKGKPGNKKKDQAAESASASQADDMDTTEVEAEAGKGLAIVQIAFNPLAIVQVGEFRDIAVVARMRSIFVKFLVETDKGELTAGAAPPPQLERLVQRDLQRATRRS